MHSERSGVFCADHPLIQHKIAQLRQTSTDQKKFRTLLHEITLFLAFEATRDLPLIQGRIETPLETFEAKTLVNMQQLVILPVLRAGLGMLDAFLTVAPTARVGHIGLSRNETTLAAELYYFKMPQQITDCPIIICDPMLATGGSAVAAVNHIKQFPVGKICLVSLVAAPEGVTRLQREHPDVRMITASLDRELNANGFILPGLGDAGDRLFGTFASDGRE